MKCPSETEQQQAGMVLPVFIHIPKTGGSSLRKIVKSNYKADEVLECADTSFLTEDKITPQTKVIMGHLHYGLENILTNYRFRYYSMMRHPLDRIVSYWWYLKHDTKNVIYKYAKDMSLLEFIDPEHPKLDREDPYVISHLEELCNGQVHRLLNFKYTREPMSDQAIFRHLKQQLSDNLFIGLLEQEDDFQELLCYHGVIKHKDYVWEKKGIGRPKIASLTDEEKETIMFNNELDYFLYQHVRETYWDAL